MKIYYQGNPGSYMHSTSLEVAQWLSIEADEIVWKKDFKEAWASLWQDNIWVLAIENSYMGTIPTSLYGFLKHDCKIIGTYDLVCNHCLCSNETDISKITQVYSQIPALEQCHKYLQQRGIKTIPYSDTALSAKFVSENKIPWTAAICSEIAAEIYGLNILDRKIQDQKDNTTRFAIVAHSTSDIQYNFPSWKISLIFTTAHIPAALYKCIWVFASNDINMRKIESLPSYKWNFVPQFWIDIEWSIEEDNIKNALKELENFATDIRILWSY